MAVVDVPSTSELAALERPRPKPGWAWWLVLAGLVSIVGLAAHGYTAYVAIAQIDTRSQIPTPNPAALFADIVTSGPRVGSAVETASRATYTRALEQLALDGTGVLLGITLLFGGVVVRLNR